jgi:predicted nucleic acid-binding protein
VRVCFDNHILIWGIRATATRGQESMIVRAKTLIEDLDRNDAEILVPAVVVAEFLAGAPKEQHTELLNVLHRRFQLPPFDVRAAAVSAGLWRDFAERNPTLREQIRTEFPGTQNVKIKADVQILATALARGAETLYTQDGPLTTLATGLIQVRELPPAPLIQPPLI